MPRARFVYLLTPPPGITGGPWAYASLEALAADPANSFNATTAAVRTARAKHGYPVTVKGHRIDKLPLVGNAELTNLAPN